MVKLGNHYIFILFPHKSISLLQNIVVDLPNMARMRGTRRGFLCPATLLPMLMLALSINQMIRPLEAARFKVFVKRMSHCVHSRQSDDYADIEDNDFAEFDFEDETDESLKVTDEEDDDFETMETEDDEAEVEVESDGEDEFSHFEDDEEFEGFKSDDLTDNPDPEEFDNVPVSPKPKPSHEKPTPPPLKQPIKIVNIPAHLRSVCHRFQDD